MSNNKQNSVDLPREEKVHVDAPASAQSDVKSSQLRNTRTIEEVLKYKAKPARLGKLAKIKETLLKDFTEQDRENYFNVISKANLTNAQVDLIQSGKITLADDTKLFRQDDDYSVTGVDPSPFYPDETPVNGAPVAQIRNFTLQDMPIYLAGPPVTTPFFKTVRPLTAEEANPHINTSLLKRTLPVLIAQNNLCACSLAEHPWLTHKSDGPVVVTAVFDTDLLVREIRNLRRCNLPILAVTQQYHPGLHIGSMYVYLSDSDGRTYGFSRGSTHTWWDLSDPIPEGNYYGYQVTTIASYGNQRLRLFMPATPEELQTIEPTEIIPIPEPAIPTIPRIKFQPTPTKFLLGTFTRKKLKPSQQPVIIEARNTSPLSKVTPIKDYAYYVDRLCAKIRHYLTPHPLWPMFILIDLVWTLALIHNLYYFVTRAINFVAMVLIIIPRLTATQSTLTTFIAAIVLLTNFIINLLNYFSSIPVIVLNALYFLSLYLGPRTRKYRIHLIDQKLYLHGDYATQFAEFLRYNTHDPDTGLPYGWYNLIGRDLIQVAQYEPCKYTNLLHAITLFCESKRYRPSSYIAVYQSIFETTTIKWDIANVKLAFESVESKIAEITASVDYEVNVDDQQRRLNLKFLNEEDYSKFLVSAINERTMAGAFSNRVGRGGVKPTLSKDEFAAYIDAFWSKFTDKERIEALDPESHVDKYSGSKLRKYLRCVLRMGGAALKPFYTSFAKIEPLPPENLNKKAVRIITMNTPIFNTYAKNFFEAFEHLLLSFTNNGMPIFAKGMNYDNRYLVILNNMKHYRYYTSTDFKNFDAHHVGPAYEAEISKYVKLGFSSYYGNLLINAPIKGAFNFKLPCRHSGDLFTGCGNCMVVGSMFLPFYSPDFTIFCDGDDTILFYNDPSILTNIEAHIRAWGHEVDPLIPTPTNQAERFVVEFCQLEYYKDGYHINLARTINKMANISVSNVDAATRTMMGKLQGLANLRLLGAEFSGSISFLRHFLPEQDYQYKLENMGDLKYYVPAPVVDMFDTSPESSSTLGKIINNINSNLLLRLCPIDHLFRKLCYKIIKRTIQNELDVQDAPQLSMQEMQEKVEYIVKNSGLKPILKELVHTLSMPTTSQNGLVTIVDCTKPTACTTSESTGLQDTPSSPVAMSTYPTIPIQHNPQSLSHSKVSSPNKTPDVPKSQPTDNSSSQPPPTHNNQTVDSAQAQTHTYSTLDTTSPLTHSTTNQSQAPSPSGSSMTVPSTHHNQANQSNQQPSSSTKRPMESSSTPATLLSIVEQDLRSQVVSTSQNPSSPVTTPLPIPSTTEPHLPNQKLPMWPLGPESETHSQSTDLTPPPATRSKQVPTAPLSIPSSHQTSQSSKSQPLTRNSSHSSSVEGGSDVSLTGSLTNKVFNTLLRRSNAIRRKSRRGSSKVKQGKFMRNATSN